MNTDPPTLKIDRDTFYTRAALMELLKPLGVDVDTFISKIRPRKVCRAFWLGADILEAYKTAPTLEDASELPTPRNKGNRQSRTESSVRSIGGTFDPREVGL